MKPLLLVLCAAVLAGCSSTTERIHLDGYPQAKFLNKADLQGVIATLDSFRYPLTRAETVNQLGLTSRNLPSMRSTGEMPGALTSDFERIDLTDPDAKGRSYVLFLWYGPEARRLGGDDFVRARVVEYADLVVRDDGRSDAPRAVSVVQSSRFDAVRRDYERRLRRED